jgi:hypothetical protein
VDVFTVTAVVRQDRHQHPVVALVCSAQTVQALVTSSSGMRRHPERSLASAI